MSITVFATRASIYEQDLESLLNGIVTQVVATRLGMNQNDLQAFIDGQPTTGIAIRFSAYPQDLDELRKRMDKQGAIGFILALLLRASFK